MWFACSRRLFFFLNIFLLYGDEILFRKRKDSLCGTINIEWLTMTTILRYPDLSVWAIKSLKLILLFFMDFPVFVCLFKQSTSQVFAPSSLQHKAITNKVIKYHPPPLTDILYFHSITSYAELCKDFWFSFLISKTFF